MNRQTHIIKYEVDEQSFVCRVAWCGVPVRLQAAFNDAQHFALANENQSSWGYPVCQDCVKAVIKALKGQ